MWFFVWVVQWVWGYTQGAWPRICSFVHLFLTYLQAAQGMLYLNETSKAYPSCENDIQCPYGLPLAFPDPCSSGEFSKDVAHSQFGYYVACSTSDSKPHKLFTDLLLPCERESGCSESPRVSLTAHDTFCNATHSAFLMSAGCAWLEDFSFHFSQ